MTDLPQPTGADLWPPAGSAEPAQVNRPWRAWVAFGEAVVAAVLVWVAFACFHRGVVVVSQLASDGAPLDSTRYLGNWIAGAIGLGVLAAILVLDAVRQLLLAVRVRSRRSRERPFTGVSGVTP